jgi:hypothetical protein
MPTLFADALKTTKDLTAQTIATVGDVVGGMNAVQTPGAMPLQPLQRKMERARLPVLAVRPKRALRLEA